MLKPYEGDIALGYDRARQGAKWDREDRALAELLSRFRGQTVLDVPCGTGRFESLYRRLEITAIGVDISADMLTLASEKGMPTRNGSIFELPFEPASFDTAVCVRLLNWLSVTDVGLALHELRRVTRNRVIVSIRLGHQRRRSGAQPHDYSIFASLCAEARLLQIDTWAIDDAGYALIALRPC